MAANKNPKSEKWLAAMHARKGKGTNQFTKAKELGLPVPPGTMKGKSPIGHPHTEETKKRISDFRIKFLRENPDKVPYRLNHSSKGPSYAEKYWKDVLDSNHMIYEDEYRIGPYQLDFAFVDAKIDLEIDGNQHYLDKRIIESDKRRNEYLKELGWYIIRIRWSDFKKLSDKKQFVDNIILEILNYKI